MHKHSTSRKQVWTAQGPAVLVYLLLLVLFAGCARFQPKPLSAARNADAFTDRSLTDSSLRAFLETNGLVTTWPRQSWDLHALILAAFYYHPDLDLARAKYQTAGAALITAGQRPNPNLSFTPRLNSSSLGTGLNPWILGGLVDIPIETAGKRKYRIGQAQHLQELARYDLANTAWLVRSRVRRNLLNLQTALETEKVVREQVETLGRVAQLVERQWQAGAVSPVEVAGARVAHNQAQLNLKEAQRQEADSRAQLAEAIGVPVRALQGLEFSFSEISEFPANLMAVDVQRVAITNRADILGALAEYAATESALQVQIAKQYPDLHLRPGYELDQNKNKWTLGVSLDLPILHQNQGPIAEAQARREEAAAKFNSIQTKAIGEIERSTGVYSAAIDQAATAEKILQDLKQRSETLGRMFEAGEVDKLAASSAQAEYLTGSLAALNARIKAQQALAGLEDAVQSPLMIPEKLHSFETSPRTFTQKDKP